MKTLQEQYNLIKEGKGHKQVFLNEAKRLYPNLVPNALTFNQTTKILKNKGVLNENYIDLQPITQWESKPKEGWESKYENFLAEEAKAIEKKTTKEVEELETKGYNYKDKSNLDNQIGQEVLNGIYFEAKQNPDKDLDEIRKIVSKNLEKDGQYYIKNAAFGVKGIGYEEKELEEVSGKYKFSGYSDKLKKMVKESLVKEAHSGNPTDKYIVKPCNKPNEPFAVWEGDVRVKGFKSKKEAQAFANKKNKEQGLKEAKKPSIDLDLSEIDKQAEIVALEAKLEKISEVIETKQQRLEMISEDENLSELIDKSKVKAMQKEIKILEKRKAKMEKMYEKMTGKAKKEEIVDETFDNYE